MKEQNVPIVYEDIYLEKWHKDPNKIGNEGLKQIDHSRTNSLPEATFNGGNGKLMNLDKASTEGCRVSQDESRDIRKRVYVVGDYILSGLNEKGLSKKHTVKVRSYPWGYN